MPRVKTNIDTSALYKFLRVVNRLYEQIEKCRQTWNELEIEVGFFNGESEYILYELFDLEDEISYRNEEPEKCFVYYILNEEKDKVKIGISNNPTERAKALQTASGEEISILKTVEFSTREEALDAEAFLHREFSEYRKRPSKVAKSTEWFDARIVPDLLKYYTSKENILKIKEYRWNQMSIDMEKLDVLYKKSTKKEAV